MPDPDSNPPSSDAPGLEAEVRALQQELAFLRKHRMFLIYQSVPKVLLFKLAIGMAAGLGTVIGATVLLSLIVWALSQIEFLPIIGDWSARIAQQIQESVNGAE